MFMLWQQWIDFKFKKANPNLEIASPSKIVQSQKPITTSESVSVPKISNNLNQAKPNTTDKPIANTLNQSIAISSTKTEDLINVETDIYTVAISKQGASIVYASLKKHKDNENKGEFVIINQQGNYQYSARSGLVSNTPGIKLPSHHTKFTFDQEQYVFSSGDSWTVQARAQMDYGVEVIKTYTFYRNRYIIDINFEVFNNTNQPLDYLAYYLLNRNGQLPKIGYFGLHTYTGPAYYTTEREFNKVSFDDIKSDPQDYRIVDDNGWVALIQHYFVSAWIIPTKTPRELFFQPEPNSNLFSAGLAARQPILQPNTNADTQAQIYIGPQDQDALAEIAEGLPLVIDYGLFTIFAEPIFWVMKKIHKYVGNWGWTIVLLTLLIKTLFFPLSAASFKSMAKMRKITPKMQRIRELYADDKQRQQQEMIKLYQTDKVNPLGGCLPILVQIPVFIALYWVLLSSVEMRNQPWIGWIQDLAKPDPYYILPVLYAISMFITTKLNPPPPDPTQRKILMAMPIVFSIIFFFFPAGLVLYWVVNNILTIFQQYYNNKKYGH